jgi:shikimate dehydrogenase
LKLFAIFGDPVSHSKSPLMHNMVFKNLNIKACYTRIHLKDGEKLREKFLSLGLSGANITVPHKEAAFRACDEVRGFGKKVGVVNTIVLEDDKLIGYNTDADGFMFAISEFSDIKKILVLGAGGTSKALVQKFLDEDIEVEVLNRSEKNLEHFKDSDAKTFTWDRFEPSSYDLVVNTTSAGLKDDNLPAPKEIIDNILSNTRYVADAIYGKLTPFLKEAKAKNIPYKDGADMLLGQGVLANQLFLHNEFTKEAIFKEMQKSFLL